MQINWKHLAAAAALLITISARAATPGGCIGSTSTPCVPVYEPPTPDGGSGPACPERIVDQATCKQRCECEYSQKLQLCLRDTRCKFVASLERGECIQDCDHDYPSP